MQDGRKPTLEEVAQEALVSRATAYRYFPGIEALLIEASLDVSFPDPEELFRAFDSPDPEARLEHADSAVADMLRTNETALRMMLVHSLQQTLDGGVASRQNRRTSLIDAALEPVGTTMDPGVLDRLKAALGLVIGTESMIVFKDVLQMEEEQAREVRLWMIRALLREALEHR
jgi:AcrR family transcriptional regulator